MDSILIPKAVSIWLDEHPAFRACGTCACGCDDMTRFICFDGNMDDLNDIIKGLPKEF